MINVEALLDGFIPDLKYNKKRVHRAATLLLRKILHQDEINQFIDTHKHLVGFEFLDAVLDHFNFSYSVSNRGRANIPAQGRLIIVANHPLGSLDGLALLKMVSEIRPDVKIVATTMLSLIEPLRDLFLSVDNFSSKNAQITYMKKIMKCLEQEQAIIMFPTGEVSRIRPQGVRDGKWKAGFVNLAYRTNAPVVPAHIQGRNSALFYSLSTLYKPLGTLLLVKEMFNKRDQGVAFTIGKPIPSESMRSLQISNKLIAKRMRKQVYRLLKRHQPPLFDTIENIAHPANRKSIRDELRSSERIGTTQDGKQIYLFDYKSNSSVIREIGRLRELSFRQVQEGTGKSSDIDDYDRYYRHLILWDDNDLEIVGTYRIGEGRSILARHGIEGFYTNSLFQFNGPMVGYLEKSIELGRSFVQPRYWGKRSLDYLWYGIGAYLRRHPEIEYMTGPVSLSASYPDAAKHLIIEFYHSLFGRDDDLVNPRQPYLYPASGLFSHYQNITQEAQYKSAYRLLKEKLDEKGVRVPALYKQYVELCEPGGCEFLGFNVDPDFSNCIDAMILVHVHSVLDKKRERYIESHAEAAYRAA